MSSRSELPLAADYLSLPTTTPDTGSGIDVMLGQLSSTTTTTVGHMFLAPLTAGVNVTDSSLTSHDHHFHDAHQSVWVVVEEIIYTRLVGAVCFFGIFGNVLNLVVLTRKSLTYTMERMEKSAHYGLVGLAVSDTLVCLAVLPSAFFGTDSFGDGQYSFKLLYIVYGQAVISTFVLSSTWLTVTMAAGRYMAVCRPLHARQFIGKRFAVWSLIVVFVVCGAFNVPRYFKTEIMVYSGTMAQDDVTTKADDTSAGAADFDFISLTSEEDESVVETLPKATATTTPTTSIPEDHPSIYYPLPGPLSQSPGLETGYQWTYFALGIAVPLTTLVYCNVHLSLALRHSIQMRRRDSASRTSATAVIRGGSGPGGGSMSSTKTLSASTRRSERAASRITMTLVAIVITYVLLFVPGELVNFFARTVAGDSEHTVAYNVTVAVLNLLQTVNFAFNFVLYCIVNSHFRRTVCRLFGCRRRRIPATRMIVNGASGGWRRATGAVQMPIVVPGQPTRWWCWCLDAFLRRATGELRLRDGLPDDATSSRYEMREARRRAANGASGTDGCAGVVGAAIASQPDMQPARSRSSGGSSGGGRRGDSGGSGTGVGTGAGAGGGSNQSGNASRQQVVQQPVMVMTMKQYGSSTVASTYV